MKKKLSLIIFCSFLLTSVFSQQTMDLKQAFLAAESYFLFEEFEEALPLYLRIHRANPDNYNLYYKIGICYLNEPYEKEKSVFYLEKAAKNINPKYKDNNFKEYGAPLDVLFFLGNAYRVNNELDKARESYKKFQAQMDNEIYDDKLVLEQLTACDAAEKLMKKPVDLDVEILSNQINTRFADRNSTVSGDETKMVFISKLQFYDAVFYTEKVNGNWTFPRNITPELGVDGDVYPTCLSYDGNTLFVYRNDDFIGNLYTSALVNGKWTPLVKLNENINTKYWESHASLTKDGNTLYFTSNRKGGFGGLDIYKSHKLANGDWGPPENLGASVNTAYNEETPFITENGSRLFFSSYGHYNMGGYDIFMSIMKSDNTWASPVNMGYPVNTTDDDMFFCPVKNGEIAYFSVYKETGYGRHDIYRYKVYTADHPRRYDISGILNYSGENVPGSEILISAINKSSGDTLASVNPGDDGRFIFSIPEGRYSVVFDSKKFEKVIKSLEVTRNTPRTGITLEDQIKLVPLPVKLSQEEIDKKLQIEDTLITVTKAKPVEIEYEAEKGSVVIIKHYLDSTLVKIDTVEIDKTRQDYEFVPQPGLNVVELTLTDKDGNQVTKTATVEYTPARDTDKEQDAQIKKSKILTPEVEKGLPQENMEALVNSMASRSDGKLKEVLTNLDLSKEGITNTAGLFSYLYENADKLGYTKEDVDRLLTDRISQKNLEEFLFHLKNASEGNLKTTISALDLKANNISTPYQAVDYLVRNSKTLLYKPEDVISALATVGSNSSDDLGLFIKKLTQSAAEGPLKNYLKTLDLNDPGALKPQDFAVNLYRNSTGNDFSEAEVLSALTILAVSHDAADILQNLTALSGEGALKDFLSILDLQKEGIYTPEQLITHLYANADLKGYTREEVDKLLQKYLYNEVAEIDELKNKMASLTTGKLKEFLEKTDLNDYSFGSREDFIGFLKSQASENGYQQDDVNNALLKLAYTGDLDNIINQLSKHAEGNLKKALEDPDLKKQGISSFDELIRYLLENSDRLGYSKDDVYKMLTDYTSAADLRLFMNKLIRESDPETKMFLENLDLKANNINDRSELISFLLKESAKGKLNQESLIKALLAATDTKIEDILPVLQSLSQGELNKVLNSSKLPVKEFKTAADLYNYLLGSVEKNKELKTEEINSLFSDYLRVEALNQFLASLIEHSDGKLKEFLQNLNPEAAGITSVSGLIQYLIDNAAENGYAENDVFTLIEKVIGRLSLEDFVANLKKFAPKGLALLLGQLDLDSAGIDSIAELMAYLAEHADEFGYSMEDAWDAILQMVISGEDKALGESLPDAEPAKFNLGRGIAFSIGILGLLGLLIIFLIILKKKKEKKNTRF